MAINSRTLFIVTLSFTLTSLIFTIAVAAEYANSHPSCDTPYYACWPTILSLFAPFGPLTHQLWFFLINILTYPMLISMTIYAYYKPGLRARPIRYAICAIYVLMNILSLISEVEKSYRFRTQDVGTPSIVTVYLILSLAFSVTPYWLSLWYVAVRSKEVWQPGQAPRSNPDSSKVGITGVGSNVIEIYSGESYTSSVPVTTPLINQSQDQNSNGERSSSVQYIYGNAGSSSQEYEKIAAIPTQTKQLPSVPGQVMRN